MYWTTARISGYTTCRGSIPREAQHVGALVRAVGSIFSSDSVPRPPPPPAAPPPLAPPAAPPAPPSPTQPGVSTALAAAGQSAIAGLQRPGTLPNDGAPPRLGAGGSLAAQTLLSDEGPGGGQSVYNQSLAARRLLAEPTTPTSSFASAPTTRPAAPTQAPTRAATAVANAPQPLTSTSPLLRQFRESGFLSEADQQALLQSQLATKPKPGMLPPWSPAPRK